MRQLYLRNAKVLRGWRQQHEAPLQAADISQQKLSSAPGGGTKRRKKKRELLRVFGDEHFESSSLMFYIALVRGCPLFRGIFFRVYLIVCLLYLFRVHLLYLFLFCDHEQDRSEDVYHTVCLLYLFCAYLLHILCFSANTSGTRVKRCTLLGAFLPLSCVPFVPILFCGEYEKYRTEEPDRLAACVVYNLALIRSSDWLTRLILFHTYNRLAHHWMAADHSRSRKNNRQTQTESYRIAYTAHTCSNSTWRGLIR